MAQIIRAVRRALGGSVVACLVLSAGVASAAAPGAFDPAFGGTGIVNAGGNSQLFGVAVQPSGEVVAAGQSGGAVVAERFSTAGALLSTYVGPSGVARGVALQADGKIIVAGGSGGMMVA